MKRLFLDDDPVRRKRFRSLHPDATIVESAEECVGEMMDERHGSWDEVYLDHDLLGPTPCYSDDRRSGMEVVRHVECRMQGLSPVPLKVGLFVLHTANRCAALEMGHRLIALGYKVELRPAHTFLGPRTGEERP